MYSTHISAPYSFLQENEFETILHSFHLYWKNTHFPVFTVFALYYTVLYMFRLKTRKSKKDFASLKSDFRRSNIQLHRVSSRVVAKISSRKFREKKIVLQKQSLPSIFCSCMLQQLLVLYFSWILLQQLCQAIQRSIFKWNFVQLFCYGHKNNNNKVDDHGIIYRII